MMRGTTTTLQLVDVPDLTGPALTRELACNARLVGEQANGYALPDTMLMRAAAAVERALRTPADVELDVSLLITYIAAQFEQSDDGLTPERKALLWEPIDTSMRFDDLPAPWNRLLGRFAALGYQRVLRGGEVGERFLGTSYSAVRVEEAVYQAAAMFETTSQTWAVLAAMEEPHTVLISKDCERIVHDDGVAVCVGDARLNARYFDALLELGVTEVDVGSDLRCVVAREVAVVGCLKPGSVFAYERPRVGEHYLVTHTAGWTHRSLVRITYVSDQRMLAVCVARRSERAGVWVPDGSEAEWSTSFGEWDSATDGEVAFINAELAAGK